MSDRQIDITRRSVLTSIGAIGIAGAGAGLGTTAYFSDEESFENNILAAGELDLRVDWEEHYWDDFDLPQGVAVTHVADASEVADDHVGLPDPDDPMIAVHEDDLDAFMDATAIEAYPDPDDDGTQADLEQYNACEDFAQLPTHLNPTDGLRSSNNDTWIDMGEGNWAPLVNLHDVKPGDFGELTLSFHLCDNPGYVWLQGEPVNAAENGHTEPEADSNGEAGGSDEIAEGADVLTSDVELLDEIQTLLWYDEDGDNVFEPGGETGEDADVVLVLDRSGSMGGTPMQNAKEAAKTLIDELGGDDKVGVVSFATSVSLDQDLTFDKTAAKNVVDGLSTGGSTNMEGGVLQGHEELLQGDQGTGYSDSGEARSDARKIMVVLGDGVPNVDDDSDGSDDPTDEAQAAKDDGIEIFTVAFGGADEELMEDMASVPKTEHAFVGEEDELVNIFSQIGQILAGEEAFFRGSLRDLLTAVSTDDGIPLDGDRSSSFDELNDDDAHPDRDTFVDSTNNFVGLAWWLPRSVGNQIQGDSVGFNLGFYTEQSRHNDGSGPTTSTPVPTSTT